MQTGLFRKFIPTCSYLRNKKATCFVFLLSLLAFPLSHKSRYLPNFDFALCNFESKIKLNICKTKKFVTLHFQKIGKFFSWVPMHRY